MKFRRSLEGRMLRRNLSVFQNTEDGKLRLISLPAKKNIWENIFYNSGLYYTSECLY